ncbi:MAG: intermembrane transport protein PqiB [Verrucomicrobium sp.]
MSEPAPPSPNGDNKPTEARAVVRRTRRWSTVWVIPLVALMLAGWLVWEHYSEKGVLAQIRFETAESVVSGKTEVRCRSVRVGVVEEVDLAQDLMSVEVAIRINPENAHLLKEGTRFWVVRPRVSPSDVSGLGTLITGSYIELDPGDGQYRNPPHHFTGLEQPPVTKSSVPGLRLTLVAENPGSLVGGSPIYFRGFEVGRVERRSFDIKVRRTMLDIFIREQFASLVHENTAFWNTSGIDISAGADGFRMRTPSLQAMMSGGASFAVPEGKSAGPEARNGAVFKLYTDEESTREAEFQPDRKWIVFFDQSVKKKKKGAPVEFRGISFGRVVEIALKHGSAEDKRIPVIIEVDPKILLQNEKDAGADKDAVLAKAVHEGLRARLGTGSLLTGALFVDVDFVPDAPPAELTRIGEYHVLPSQSSGLVQLEEKVNAILNKIAALPIEDTLNKFGKTADEVTTTVAEARGAVEEIKKLVAAQETQKMTAEVNATLREMRSSVESLGPSGNVQGDLRRTLDELRAALRAFKTLSDTVEDKPNSLIFGRESSGDPTPKARK